ncbi:MAG: alcohol dehydrogenase catalytic domain-containing protein [Spirochaetota bacterium]|nr:alcohol dehydrogenase catalytic domain-containing protein [Spirochaetota bacterium]
MKSMWAYVYNGTNVLKKRVPIPSLRPNDVLIKIEKVSICGSDFHIFHNDDWAKGTISPGIVIGHEGCGTVIAIGPNVNNIKLGDYVALESHYACQNCESLGNTADNCSHYGIIGIHGTSNGMNDREIGGVFAQMIAIPEYCCYKVSDKIISSIYPSLLEPAGNSWEIIRFIKHRNLPNHYAIYGCGPHGLNMQLFARYVGIKNIIAFETDPWRLNFAREFGAAHHVLNPNETTVNEILDLTEGQGFDLAIDMVGNIDVVKSCKENIRDGAMIILFGLPRHEGLISHGENFSQIIFNNQELVDEYNGKRFMIRGFTGRTNETWIELLNVLDSSEWLREKLSLPLTMIGSLNKLEDFIKNPSKNFLKIGMTSFDCNDKNNF